MNGEMTVDEVNMHCEELESWGLIRNVHRDPNDSGNNTWEQTDFGKWIFENHQEVVLIEDPTEELKKLREIFEYQKSK